MSNISCILYPPTLDFHYLVQRPQQLMKSFSQLNIPTYYINWSSSNIKKESMVQEISPNLFLFDNVDPKPYLQNLQPVVYYTSAAHVEMIKEYNPSLVVFDSVDEPSDEFEGWRPYYHQAVSSADIVITTSDKLYHMARVINPNTYLVPNGCDYEYFSQSRSGNLLIPSDVSVLQKPIIGYIGVIATWCDLELVDKISQSFPNCNLVMIGPFYNTVKVPRRENIHWLGFKQYEELAAYAQTFDVGIIPFKKTSMVESVNPIKMWEYLATGMPIVTTPIPETKKYGDIILHSDDHEQFIENIKIAMYNDPPELKLRRMALARENSWLARANQIVQIIENELDKRKKDGGRKAPLPSKGSITFRRGVGMSSYTRNLTSVTQLSISKQIPFKLSIKYSNQSTVPSRSFSKGSSNHQQQVNSVGKVTFRFSTARGHRIGVEA